jgi:hypothetical protein
MTPLFGKKKPVSRAMVMESVTAENPIHHLPLPPFDPNEGMGRGFNIVKVVEEHAPVRIKAIEDELDQLNRKHAELSYEKLQLTKLLTAIKN